MVSKVLRRAGHMVKSPGCGIILSMKKILFVILIAIFPLAALAAPAIRADFSPPPYESFSFTSAVVVDAVSGKELFSYNADEKLPAASLTKLLGAMVVLDW